MVCCLSGVVASYRRRSPGEQIWGRGSSDDKGGLIGLLWVLTPPKDVTYFLTFNPGLPSRISSLLASSRLEKLSWHSDLTKKQVDNKYVIIWFEKQGLTRRNRVLEKSPSIYYRPLVNRHLGSLSTRAVWFPYHIQRSFRQQLLQGDSNSFLVPLSLYRPSWRKATSMFTCQWRLLVVTPVFLQSTP